jgi:hypothetical protein
MIRQISALVLAALLFLAAGCGPDTARDNEAIDSAKTVFEQTTVLGESEVLRTESDKDGWYQTLLLDRPFDETQISVPEGFENAPPVGDRALLYFQGPDPTGRKKGCSIGVEDESMFNSVDQGQMAVTLYFLCQ